MELHQRLLLSCAAALLGAATTAGAATLGQLGRLAGEGAQVSALVWDLDTGQHIAQLNAGRALSPASLSKIVIAAAALETWGPEMSFPTELRSLAPPREGMIEGQLVLRGSGDATLDETTLWGLAAQLRGLGVRRVTGGLLVERTPFGELDCDTIDRCAGARRTSRAYNAAPSAIGVNYGSWCVAIRAPASGATRASVGGCATGEMPIPVAGSVGVATGGAPLRVDRTTDDAGDRIHVGGTLPPGTQRQLHRAMSDPAAGTGVLLRSILRQAGITVEGGVLTRALVTSGADTLLARVDGLPLQEQIGRMMRYSNNYIADVLTMSVAMARSGAPPATLAAASNELSSYVRAGAGPGSVPVMLSGSGLTPENRLSAQDLVGVLRRLYRDSRRFPVFYGSFVVPADAPFEYLRRGGEGWRERVALKTGSLTEPVSVSGIAGYLRKRSGGWMAFAIIVNGTPGRQIARDRALGAARADLEAILAAN